MGKPDDVQIHLEAGEVASAGAASSGAVIAVLRRVLSLRCVVVLVLSACVLLSAVFWLPPFRRSHRSAFAPDDPFAVSAEIQASFILEKPMSLLSANTKRLEYDIMEEIGVPNSKVAIISMQPLSLENSTHVVFGVLPDPHSALISTAALSVLRSSLVDLVLQQLNLSLSSTIFGYPSSFELLKFPGGITVIPVQSASIWERTQSLFQFKLNNSVKQILKNIDLLKDELKNGLNLRSFENVFVDITNSNGSTVATPVIIQASVLSDVGNSNLQPDRLKQLAQLITGSHDHNLGLAHSVFGKVKEVELSSYLEHSISSLAPSPSPFPSPLLSPSSSPSHASYNPIHSPGSLAPSNSHSGCPHCSSCRNLSPSKSPLAPVPSRKQAPYQRSLGPVRKKDNFPPAYDTHLSHSSTPAPAPVHLSLSSPAGYYGANPTDGNRRGSPSSTQWKRVLVPTPAAAPVHSSLAPAVSFSSSPTEANRASPSTPQCMLHC